MLKRSLVSAQAIALAVLATAAVFGAPARAAEVLRVAASPVPHAEILEFVKPRLKAAGVDLQIKVFTDYIQPNLQVEEKHLDANFFQHRPYLESFNREHGTHLVEIPDSKVHVEPFGAYSKKIKSVAALREGAIVAIPNDPSNSGRALVLLQKQGLIKLRDPSNILATARDITFNPKKLKMRELEAATLPRVLDDVDLALINTNYALEAGLDPMHGALFIEGADSPYANFVAARPDNAASPAIRKLVQALHSPDVREFIKKKYKGAIVPAF
jgi:D-methionine transport system substrate-binding protein